MRRLDHVRAQRTELAKENSSSLGKVVELTLQLHQLSIQKQALAMQLRNSEKRMSEMQVEYEDLEQQLNMSQKLLNLARDECMHLRRMQRVGYRNLLRDTCGGELHVSTSEMQPGTRLLIVAPEHKTYFEICTVQSVLSPSRVAVHDLHKPFDIGSLVFLMF